MEGNPTLMEVNGARNDLHSSFSTPQSWRLLLLLHPLSRNRFITHDYLEEWLTGAHWQNNKKEKHKIQNKKIKMESSFGTTKRSELVF